MQNLQLVQEAAQELYKNKDGQIVALDVQGMTVICDYMLIAAGRTVNQVKALAEETENTETSRDGQEKSLRGEKEETEWENLRKSSEIGRAHV